MKDLSNRDERIDYETEKKRTETFHCPLCPHLFERDPAHEVDGEGILVAFDATYQAGSYRQDESLDAKALNLVCVDCAELAFGYETGYRGGKGHKIRRTLNNYVTTDDPKRSKNRYLAITSVIALLCGISGVILGYEGVLTPTGALTAAGIIALGAMALAVFFSVLSVS